MTTSDLLRQVASPEVARRIANRFLERRDFPAFGLLELFLTNDCNMRCDYCFVGTKSPEYMTEATALAAFEYMLKRSGRHEVLNVLLFGGEPMLCFDLIRAIVPRFKQLAERESKAVSWSMTTNGTLFDRDRLRYCRDNGIKFLLSVDGVGEHHDHYRHYADGRGSFEDIMSALPLMRQYQPWIGTRYTVAPDTVPYLAEDARCLNSLGINQFLIGPAYGLHWTEPDLREFYNQMLVLRDYRIQRNAQGGYFRMTLFEGPDVGDPDQELTRGRYTGVWGCGAGRGRLCCGVNGDLYGCSKLMTVHGAKSEGIGRFGNAHEDITDLAVRAEFCDYNEQLRTRCHQCGYRDECSGCCPATNYQGTGSMYVPTPLDCAFAKVFIALGQGRQQCPDVSFINEMSAAPAS